MYDAWHDPSGKKTTTYTIITTAPNELVAAIHNRMPVILKREDEERWLSGETFNARDVRDILVPYPPGEMTMHPVSSLVNSPAIDDERVIAPLNSLDTSTEYTE